MAGVVPRADDCAVGTQAKGVSGTRRHPHHDRWVCPLAPNDNTIDLPIPAGERLATA